MRIWQLTFDLSFVSHLWSHGVLRQHRVHLWYLVQVSAIAPPNHKLSIRLLLILLQPRMLALGTSMLESRVSQSSSSVLLLCSCKLFLVIFICQHLVVE